MMVCPECNGVTVQDKVTFWECEECSYAWEKDDNKAQGAGKSAQPTNP